LRAEFIAASSRTLEDFLILLSICETCKYKNVGFLDFLRSGARPARATLEDASSKPRGLNFILLAGIAALRVPFHLCAAHYCMSAWGHEEKNWQRGYLVRSTSVTGMSKADITRVLDGGGANGCILNLSSVWRGSRRAMV